MLELQNVKTEYMNNAQIKIRNSLYEGEKIAGSKKATKERKEKALHRGILWEPDTQTSTKKSELKDSKH